MQLHLYCNKCCVLRCVVVRGGGNTVNKQSQLATQHLLRDKLHENVARITWPYLPSPRASEIIWKTEAWVSTVQMRSAFDQRVTPENEAAVNPTTVKFTYKNS